MKACNRPRPTQGLPGPSARNPRRVRKKSGKRRTPKVLKECALESQKSPKSSLSDSFWTLSPGRTLSGLWGPALGYSFRTLLGGIWGSGPEGSGRPSCLGRGRLQIKAEVVVVAPLTFPTRSCCCRFSLAYHIPDPRSCLELQPLDPFPQLRTRTPSSLALWGFTLSIRAEKGLSTLISGEKAPNPLELWNCGRPKGPETPK